MSKKSLILSKILSKKKDYLVRWQRRLKIKVECRRISSLRKERGTKDLETIFGKVLTHQPPSTQEQIRIQKLRFLSLQQLFKKIKMITIARNQHSKYKTRRPKSEETSQRL